MVKQAPARPAALAPQAEPPRILIAPFGTAGLDALLAVVPAQATARHFAQLPDAARWRALHARDPARPGTVRSTTLGNARHTLAVLGYLAADAGSFERLSLAARLVRELAARGPESLGLAAVAAPGMHEALLAAALAQAFELPSWRTAPQVAPRRLRRIVLAPGHDVDLPHARAAAAGNNLARWLTALPPNRLDAGAYHRLLARLARDHGLAFRWLDERALRRLGAHAFLAVAAGNAAAGAGIAHLAWRPRGRRRRTPDVALIGKGILFDTGGVNLKPHRAMLEMHTDMAGSAVALATLLALAQLRAPLAADAWLAITENHIGPHAYRPQEVVRAANGVTIQVIHTDAEGRMVLADTLALAGRTQPRFMLDFATLTGACVQALTERMSGVFTNRPALAAALLAAGRASGERVWHFPCEADYDAELESRAADVLQCPVEGKGDHIYAARFLSRFVPAAIPWAHVDLASASRSGGLGHVNTDITGFGVRYALELLLRTPDLWRTLDTC